MKQPWLSVIIPTYNGQEYLSLALDSVVIQGDDEIECIVVDDGSTDDTLSIVETYQDKLPIKLVKRQRQGNWVTNTNYALSLARAEHACFLHQDDLWLKGRLQTMKSLVEQQFSCLKRLCVVSTLKQFVKNYQPYSAQGFNVMKS